MRKKTYPLQKQKAPKFFIQTVHQYLNIRNDLTSRGKKTIYLYFSFDKKSNLFSFDKFKTVLNKLDEKTSIE